MPSLLKLASEDKQTEVREAAMDALQRGYLCFGEKLRQDIVKRRPSRLPTMLRRLDEVQTSEDQLQTFNLTVFQAEVQITYNYLSSPLLYVPLLSFLLIPFSN